MPLPPAASVRMRACDRGLPDRWGIFSLIDQQLLGRAAWAVVFGGGGNEAILVTNDDCVYSLGTNCSGCLGLGDAQNCLSAVKLDALCGRRLKLIACGNGPHVLALTADGEVYTWGHNGYCQLGNGSTTQLLSPTLCSLAEQRRVTSVACGSHHSLALTADGEVLGWGQNNYGQVGSGTTTNQPAPRRVGGQLAGRTCRHVGCCHASSFAVDEAGEAFGWGYNGNGQLGIGTNANQASPSKLDGLPATLRASRLACGFGHSLLLDDDGNLYAWGANSYGQLGTGGKVNSLTPVRVLADCGRLRRVGAVHYSNTSAAVTETGLVLAWGHLRGQSVPAPIETQFQSVNDVFACLSSPPVTCERLVINTGADASVTDSLRLAFDDEATSDLTILVDGRSIRVHRAILRIRCQHFRSMFNDSWAESQQSTIEINDYSYEVYRAFLEYLYTDWISLPPQEAVGLLDLANCYCEVRLKALCETLVKQSVTVNCALPLYSAAIKYAAPELENFCFEFCVRHLSGVVLSESFQQMDEECLKRFMTRAAKSGAFKH